MIATLLYSLVKLYKSFVKDVFKSNSFFTTTGLFVSFLIALTCSRFNILLVYSTISLEDLYVLFNSIYLVVPDNRLDILFKSLYL